MQMLNRYLAIELGVQAPGWDWTYKRGGSHHTDNTSSHETGENNGKSESEEKSPQIEFWAFPVFRGWGDKEAPTEESEKEPT